MKLGDGMGCAGELPELLDQATTLKLVMRQELGQVT